MTRLTRYLSVLTLVALLAGSALAKPKVALLQLLQGSATLSGKNLTTPTLASEGDKLHVASNSKVRIQLLGDSRELTVEGDKTVTLSKSELGRKAANLPRGAVAVAQGIGNVSRGAAGTSRTVGVKAQPKVGVSLILPSTGDAQNWTLGIKVDPSHLTDPTLGGDITLQEIGANGKWTEVSYVAFDDFPEELWEEGGEASKSFSGLQPGKVYQALVQIGSGNPRYERLFCILTPAQREMLQVMDASLRAEYKERQDVVPLLKLANLYVELGQLPEAEEILKEALDSPWRDASSEIGDVIAGVREPIREALDLGPASP